MNKVFGKNLISIIIPCYNELDYIEDTLKSILVQSYKNLELIIVDDCSDDFQFLRDKIYSICLNKIPFFIIRLEERHGASYARNKGFKFSCGEYLFFCDADVVLEKDSLEQMLVCLKSNLNCSWVYGNYLLGERLKRFYPFNKEKMYLVNCSSTMSLIKREDFPLFDESLKKLQDWDLFLTMLENGKQGVWLDKIIFKTPIREHGITLNSISEKVAREIIKKKHPKVKRLI